MPEEMKNLLSKKLVISIAILCGVLLTGVLTDPTPTAANNNQLRNVEEQRKTELSAADDTYKDDVQEANEDHNAANKQAMQTRDKKQEAASAELQKVELNTQKSKEKIDQLVKDGKMTPANAASSKKSLDDNLKKLRQDFQQKVKKANDEYNKALDSNAQKRKQAIEQAKKDRDKTKNEINQEADWQRAIEHDRDKFNVGIILRTNEQKTYFDRAKESKKPVIIEIIDKITSFLLRLSIPLAVLGIIIGGYMMMFANGDDNMLQKGKETIKYIAIGLVIIFCSYLIVQFIISILFQKVT